MNYSKTNVMSGPSKGQGKAALNNMKFEVANELGVNLKQGYNGDITSKEAGYIGGYMVKRMIDQVESQHSNG